MLTNKEKQAAIDGINLTNGLIEDEAFDKETGLATAGFGDFAIDYLRHEFAKKGFEPGAIKMSAGEKREVKKILRAAVKGMLDQVFRAIDEEL